MTNDDFTKAARAEAEALVEDIICWDDTIATDGPCDGTWDSLAVHLIGRGWARTHLAAQEVTDKEALAYLDAFCEELPDAFEWTPDTVTRVKRGLSAARAPRRAKETR